MDETTGHSGESEVKVTYRLPDGQVRTVGVTPDLHEVLRGAGDQLLPAPDEASLHHRMRRGIIRAAAVWIMALLVTAVVVPAVTRQWNERSKALELKTTLVRELGESSAVAVSNARFLAAIALPDAAVVTAVCKPRLLTSPSGSDRCARAREVEVRATAAVNFSTRTAWRRSAASLQARVATYFPEQEHRWRKYADSVDRFLSIPTSLCSDADTRRLLEYLGQDEHRPKWQPLFHLTRAECDNNALRREHRAGYASAVRVASDVLLQKRETLLRALRSAHADGFSTTFWDIVKDVWWAVLLIVGLMMVYIRSPRSE